MAILTNSLETIELGATAWRVIHNNNITKLDESLYRVRADSGDSSSGFLSAKVQHSLAVDTSAHKMNLVNDEASPGAGKLYATSAAGTRGWQGNPVVSGSITVSGLFAQNQFTPASAAASTPANRICWDADYIYVATGVNTWKRVAIATW